MAILKLNSTDFSRKGVQSGGVSATSNPLNCNLSGAVLAVGDIIPVGAFIPKGARIVSASAWSPTVAGGAVLEFVYASHESINKNEAAVKIVATTLKTVGTTHTGSLHNSDILEKAPLETTDSLYHTTQTLRGISLTSAVVPCLRVTTAGTVTAITNEWEKHFQYSDTIVGV